MQIRNEDWIQSASQLYQQYIVNQYAKIEQNHLNYLRQNQSSLRTECYQEIVDAIHAGDSANNIGHHIILPSTFSGRPQQMYQLYQNAIAIVHHFGKPDLLLHLHVIPNGQKSQENYFKIKLLLTDQI